jgi:hypothetical protein
MASLRWQDWTVGQQVAVGFLRDLTVVEKVPTPGDGLPDAFILANKNRTKTYRFVPYNGIERLD